MPAGKKFNEWPLNGLIWVIIGKYLSYPLIFALYNVHTTHHVHYRAQASGE